MTGSRPACRLCGRPLARTFVDLGKSPLCESFLTTEQLDQVEPFYPLHVRICDECLLVQLEAYVPAEEIFRDYAYFSAYSESWVAHAAAYADVVAERFGLGPDSLVVELASNDGYLLQHFVQRGIPALGIDPAENVAEAARERGVETVVDFFDSRLAEQLVAEGRRPDLIAANNVLAQVPPLNDFVAGIEIVLAPHGVATIEVPHIVRLIEGLQFDTIYHEHYSYFSLTTLVRLFSDHRLEVFDVEELPSHGGSLRVYVKRQGDDLHELSPQVARVLDDERAGGYDTVDGYADFAHSVEEVKWSLLELLIGLRREGKRVVGYGAPGKGNTLLNYCGIRTDLLEYTVDRNPHKHGKHLPGTHIPIYAPSRIDESRPDYILLLPWNLKKEIMVQLSHARDWGAQLIVPIPKPEVLAWRS
jgi:SAM-dependent methyltransferase